MKWYWTKKQAYNAGYQQGVKDAEEFVKEYIASEECHKIIREKVVDRIGEYSRQKALEEYFREFLSQ